MRIGDNTIPLGRESDAVYTTGSIIPREGRFGIGIRGPNPLYIVNRPKFEVNYFNIPPLPPYSVTEN